MSVALMSLAFRARVPSTQKLVLLALCDSANDQGECYPAVSTLVAKCSLSERAVQGAMTMLEASGHLRREPRNGRSTVYWVTPHEREVAPPQNVVRLQPRAATPAAPAPPQLLHPAAPAPTPAAPAPPPPQHVHPTPAERAPITINEPSIEPSRKQKKAPPPLAAVEDLVAAGFDARTAEEFIAHKAARKAPLTARAWADHLREAAKAGWTPLAAAEKVMARNWSGFEAKYVAQAQGPGTAPRMSTAERDAEARRLLGFTPYPNTETLNA